METKQCSQCRERFPNTRDYFREGRSKCRTCDKENLKAYRSAPEYKARCQTPEFKAMSRARNQTYREKNPDKIKARLREWNETHREQKDAKQREWYDAHYGQIIARQRKWAKAHPEKLQKYRRVSKARHPEMYRAAKYRRRAREASLPAAFTVVDMNKALEYFHGACAYCGNPPSLFDVHATLHGDHFIPLADIDNCPGTVPTNMLPACQSCNHGKGSSDPHEWIAGHFGQRKAKQILKRIEDYFASLR